ncbi:MAG: Fic family protein [Clostridia bacterium]|nr:Fic family protein [Lachnospiraceae bacterium]NCC00035.1 Fic family protein [Clostridia bacterium]NCD01879.1 Fic family protein [Clostridia bacterium]
MSNMQPLIISEDMIKDWNRKFSESATAGIYRSEVLKSGAAPDDIERLMGHFTEQIRSSLSTLSPSELAAMAAKRLSDIRPFTDKNKETAEALKDFILNHYNCSQNIDGEELFSNPIIFN